MPQNSAEPTVIVVLEKTGEGHLGRKFKKYYTQPKRKEYSTYNKKERRPTGLATTGVETAN